MPRRRSLRHWCYVGIPVKANMIPEGRRTAFRSEGEQQSERSDADMVIVEEVFGIVKGDCPERSGGRFGGDLGCRGKGQQPLCPCFLDVEEEYSIRAAFQLRV
jgi:hypothetical protein